MIPRNTEAIRVIIRTTPVCRTVCSRLGQLTFLNSPFTSAKKPAIRLNILDPKRGLVPQSLAGQGGLEPTTLGFGDRCSTNWSYWPTLDCRRQKNYFVSLCSVCFWHQGQYFFSSIFWGF